MWHVGIDLHREFVVMAAVRDNGEVMEPVKIACQESESTVEVVRTLTPFRAVIEASGTYRWLYDLLRPHGVILLAHPLRLCAMIQRRSKTDKLDAQLLANLLRINQIPLAYVPPEPYQRLRDLVRCRGRLAQDRARENQVARHAGETEPAVALHDTVRQSRPGVVSRPGLRPGRKHAPRRIAGAAGAFRSANRRFRRATRALSARLSANAGHHRHPRHRHLLGAADRGRTRRGRTICAAKQVGAYAGLTSRVHQSGGHCYQGSITRQGSPWLRWSLVEAAMKTIRQDAALKNFYTRVRKRSSAKIARVAAARKLAEICWKRLRRWQREHASRVA